MIIIKKIINFEEGNEMNIKDILTIAKRELKLCFSEKIMLATVVLVPFALIFGFTMLLSVMLKSENNISDIEEFKSYSINAPDAFEEMLNELNITPIEADKVEKTKEDIIDKKAELLIVFPEDFKISEVGSISVSNIDIWYNSVNLNSMKIYSLLSAQLDGYQPTVFAVNGEPEVRYDLASNKDELLSIIGMMMPMMLIMAIYTVCMNIAAESIAGDKERGFLNTVLMTPIKRSSIAAGKALSIYILSIIGGISAFLGMRLSISQVASAMKLKGGFSYGLKEYLVIFIAIIVVVFAMASLLLVVSALSKSVKQATTIGPVVMMILMCTSLLTSVELFNAVIDNLGMVNAFIPIWNVMLSVQKIMMLDYSMTYLLISCGVDIAFCFISVLIICRLFKSEKIVNV